MLGVQLTHSKPGEAAGRGKIERFFRTVRSQFLVEVEQRDITDLDELNRLFTAWVEQRYHRRVHTETGQTPLQRFMADGIPDVPSPALLREAFLWSAVRTVTKTATVSLIGNRYEVDPALVGRKIDCVFDPFDLSTVEVRYDGRSFGMAAVHRIGTHVHPKAAGRHHHDERDAQTPPPTGIDYLALVEQEHRDATRSSINFAAITRDDHDTDVDDFDPAGDPSTVLWHEPPLPFPDNDPDRHDDDDDGGTVAGVAR